MNISELIIKLLSRINSLDISVTWTWPFFAFILLLVYRKQIANLLTRLIKGKVGSFSFEVTPLKQEKAIKEDKIRKSNDVTIEFIRKNPEKALNGFINTYNAYLFERNFNMIYGTQINLLECLANKKDKSEKWVNLFTFYYNFMTKTTSPRITFVQYLGFLESCKFIKTIIKDNEKIAKISLQGLNFLYYIRSQYPTIYKHKPF